MAVKVERPGSASPKTHEAGIAFTVEDGHLHVWALGQRVIEAIYAPGMWRSAVMADEKQD